MWHFHFDGMHFPPVLIGGNERRLKRAFRPRRPEVEHLHVQFSVSHFFLLLLTVQTHERYYFLNPCSEIKAANLFGIDPAAVKAPNTAATVTPSNRLELHV